MVCRGGQFHVTMPDSYAWNLRSIAGVMTMVGTQHGTGTSSPQIVKFAGQVAAHVLLHGLVVLRREPLIGGRTVAERSVVAAVELQEEENSNSAQRDEQQIPHGTGTKNKHVRPACSRRMLLTMKDRAAPEPSLQTQTPVCVSIPARYSACEPIQMASQHALRKRTRQGTHRSRRNTRATSHKFDCTDLRPFLHHAPNCTDFCSYILLCCSDFCDPFLAHVWGNDEFWLLNRRPRRLSGPDGVRSARFLSCER